MASWSLWQSLSCCVVVVVDVVVVVVVVAVVFAQKFAAPKLRCASIIIFFHIGFINFAPNKFVRFEIMGALFCSELEF